MNRLKELREAYNMNMKQAADALGYKYMTYVSYEKEDRSLYSEQLVKIAEFYDVSIDYILCRDNKVVQFKPPLVQKYEKLDETSKAVVDAVVDLESSRIIEAREKKIIPLFPAAAGPTDPMDGNDFDNFESEDLSADFAVRISGDSMEPFFKGGEVVLCKRKESEEDYKAGDIVVVLVNGCLLVKQFFPGYNGQFYLRSLNRQREDNDYDYLPSSGDTKVFWGTVICKRIPLVQQ